MILIDTNVLVGLVDQRLERVRGQAMNELDRLDRKRILLTWPVMAETLHYLRRRDQRLHLYDLIARLDLSFVEDEQQVDRSLLFRWLERYNEHEPDLADAYLVTLTMSNRRWQVWTYDSEFVSIWRRLDGSAVPMAVKY